MALVNTSKLTVSIVITTKNRKDDLARCLASCRGLKNVNEVLVFDDGSTDETYDFVKQNYPSVSLYRSETSLGLINARTKCAGLAKSDIIISIDDDCVFQGQETIAQVLTFFNHTRVAAITIPVINKLVSDDIAQKGAGGNDEFFICSQYAGCAHAVRKDIFLFQGGYYDNLVRQEEETEYCMRLYGDGYFVRIANCDQPILHFHSSSRNLFQISFFRARNQLIVNYKNAPLLFVPMAIIIQALSLIKYEFANKQMKACLKGFGSGFKNILIGKVKRTPISVRKYLFFKNLRSKGRIKIYID